jgi:hypothetical protein
MCGIVLALKRSGARSLKFGDAVSGMRRAKYIADGPIWSVGDEGAYLIFLRAGEDVAPDGA